MVVNLNCNSLFILISTEVRAEIYVLQNTRARVHIYNLCNSTLILAQLICSLIFLYLQIILPCKSAVTDCKNLTVFCFTKYYALNDTTPLLRFGRQSPNFFEKSVVKNYLILPQSTIWTLLKFFRCSIGRNYASWSARQVFDSMNAMAQN